MDRWMIVYKNMRWEEIAFNKNGNKISIKLLKKGDSVEGRVIKENEVTKVIRVLLNDGREVELADFNEIDSFFEANTIIFKNRPGLHKEIRRYIDFSLS
jgi:exosome complex RNA-binding protein Csl4